MRLIIAVIIFTAAEISILAMDVALMPQPAQLPARALDQIPRQLTDWTSTDIPIDQTIIGHSGAAAMLNRVYSNSFGDEVAVNIGIWLSSDSGLPHSPEECYTGAGWEISSRTLTTLPGTIEDCPAMLLAMQKSGQRISVLYWYQCGDKILVSSDRLRAIRQALRGSQDRMPPVVKVMLQSNHPDSVVAQRKLLELAGQLFPEVAQYK